MAISRLKKSAMAQWVEAALEHAKMDQAELARQLAIRLHADFDRSKVNKMVVDKRRVTGPEMLAIEEVTGHPIPAALRDKPAEPKASKKAVSVPLLDFVTAGKLKPPASQIPIEDVPLLAFADLGKGEWFALKLEDDADSMDRLSPPNSIVIVNKADRELRSGKCYIFSIDGDTTYKMWQDGEPPYLAPYSTNPTHKPIFIKRRRAFDVIGRVKRTVLDL